MLEMEYEKYNELVKKLPLTRGSIETKLKKELKNTVINIMTILQDELFYFQKIFSYIIEEK